MEFPWTVREQIEKLVHNIPVAQLKKTADKISGIYRGETTAAAGKRILTEDEAAVYAAVRMPATFGAVSAALGYALECTDVELTSLMDIGAGTGAAVLAADGVLSLDRIICLERESAMQEVGRKLLSAYGGTPSEAVWLNADIAAVNPGEKADLVISSYMLNELENSRIAEAVISMWAAADKMLLIVEPGTPSGFGVIRKIRELLIGQGAYIAAPCPHSEACPIKGDDWCHFGCRVARSRLHKQLKGGDAPYEDEKFTYIAVCKNPCSQAQARVMRHPYVEKGRVSLEMCTKTGLEQRTVTAREKKSFKQARKLRWGDSWTKER